MSCCKNNKRTNPYTEKSGQPKSNKYKLIKWVLFVLMCLISPIFLIPMLYMLYVAVIRDERIDLMFMLQSLGEIIKTHKLIKAKPDVNLAGFEVYEVK